MSNRLCVLKPSGLPTCSPLSSRWPRQRGELDVFDVHRHAHQPRSGRVDRVLDQRPAEQQHGRHQHHQQQYDNQQ